MLFIFTKLKVIGEIGRGVEDLLHTFEKNRNIPLFHGIHLVIIIIFNQNIVKSDTNQYSASNYKCNFLWLKPYFVP